MCMFVQDVIRYMPTHSIAAREHVGGARRRDGLHIAFFLESDGHSTDLLMKAASHSVSAQILSTE